MAATTIRCHAEEAQNNWICPITEDIDRFLVSSNSKNHSYLYISELDLEDLAPLISIRVPGISIGTIALNKDFEITNVDLNTFAQQYFASDPSKVLKKYIGCKLEVDL